MQSNPHNFTQSVGRQKILEIKQIKNSVKSDIGSQKECEIMQSEIIQVRLYLLNE